MRLNFRQGVVSHQTGGFLNLNPSGHVDLIAANRPVTVTVAHGTTDYLWSEDGTETNAWLGPFDSGTYYWLYWRFNNLTFERTFGYTELEPVYQPVAPGANVPPIVGVIAGPGAGSPDAFGAFIVDGYFIMPAGRIIEVRNSTGNDDVYSVAESVYDPTLQETTIFVNQEVLSSVVDGNLYIDFDTFGEPLQQTGRIWFNTSNYRTYEYTGSSWAERIIVFAARLFNLSFSPLGPNFVPNFTGTQIGVNQAIKAGRVLFTESNTPISRDDGTFITTEDQLFANASRVDALRLESNVARATSPMVLGAFSVVGWTGDGVISVADYDMVGRGDSGDPLPPDDRTTVLGILTEELNPGEAGSVIIQGVVTNPDWNWLDVTRIGAPLWVDNGMLVPQDPHFTDVINFPTGRVPVARVLARDTVVFEQGLGGKGDRGRIGPDLTLPYDMSFFVSGSPDTVDVTLGMFPIIRPVFIDMENDQHFAVAETASDATVTYRLRKNGTEVGTVVFTSGNVIGTVNFPADVDLDAGDVFKLVAPAVANAVIANVAVTISGCAFSAPYCATS